MTKKFILKLIIFTLPLSLVIASYVVFDPFKVLYSYDDFYKDYFVNINRDYVSSRKFIRNYDTYHYNSFIFGSSRTVAFRTQDWLTYLDTSATPYMFDASSEKIAGIYDKINFLDSKNVNIKNALIVLCTDHTFTSPQQLEEPLLVKDPEVEGEYRYLNFQWTFFSAYLSDYFFIRYLKYRLFHKKSDGFFMEFIDIKADVVSNDLYLLYRDKKLAEDSVAYYNGKDSVFYQRSGKEIFCPAQIDETMKGELLEIKNIFDKRKTKYEFIISPLYDQKKFSKKDMEILTNIFGEDHIHDFSGVNEITNNKYNYYEGSHYRPFIGKKIMTQIYSR